MKKEVIYLHEGRTDINLTAYILDDALDLRKDSVRPAILICPGGAYLNCSDGEADPIALQFAAMGYHTFVLRYGVYSEGVGGSFIDTSKPMEPKAHCRHPAPMRDIAAAMLIIRSRATEWLVDTNRIALCGFSAGAHNCAMYATNWHKPVITEFFGKGAEEFRPAACILGYGLSDYVYMKENALANLMATNMFAASNTAFLGAPVVDNALLEEVSPARNVSEHTPPTFLWATSEDDLVPVQHTILMAKALADKHIPFEVHIFESGNHGLSTATQASAVFMSGIDNDAAKWVSLCNAWLLKRFAMELPKFAPWEMSR